LTQESSFNRDILFVPFKAPVTTLAPSICKLSEKLLSDSEHASQTTSAYSKDEHTKDLNKTSSVWCHCISMALGGLIFWKLFYEILIYALAKIS